jgi:hypothetical protein
MGIALAGYPIRDALAAAVFPLLSLPGYKANSDIRFCENKWILNRFRMPPGSHI